MGNKGRIETIDIGRGNVSGINEDIRIENMINKKTKKKTNIIHKKTVTIDPRNESNQILKQATHAYDETKVHNIYLYYYK